MRLFNYFDYYRRFCVIVATLILFGCGPIIREHQIATSLTLFNTEVEKAPFIAGLYINDDLRKYQKILPLGGWECKCSFGKALSIGFENITRKLFKDVSLMQFKELNNIPIEINYIVIPEIVQIEYLRPSIFLKIRWTIKDRHGNLVYTNTFLTERKLSLSLIGIPCNNFFEACENALHDNLAESLSVISSSRLWKAL